MTKPLLRKPVKLFTLGALYVMLLTQTGCLLVAAAAGTGATVAYVSGDLNTSVNATPDRVAAASKAAMQRLEINVISVQSSSLDAKVVGRTATDKKLTVVAKSSGVTTASDISVRAGTFGDDALQARLLEEIKKELTGATASVPAPQPASAAVPSTQPTAGAGD